jgi:outer membrane protein
MKIRYLLTFSFLLLFSGGIIRAQADDGELSLSLKDARDYAILNNKAVISARLEIDASKMALWEAISAGLPQVMTSASFNDNLKLMTTLLPGEFFGQPPGTYIPIKFGQQFNTNATLQASILLFNVPYIIGVETSKLAQKLSEHNLEKSELDTKEAISTTYYLILISERSLRIVESNIGNLRETLGATQAMYSAGMAEKTDVDQMVSNQTMVENSRSSLQRSINYNLLRFQLGVPAGTRITLKDSLEGLTAGIDVEAMLSQQFNYKENVDFRIMEGQEKMSSLNLKTQLASNLPTLSGFYNYGVNGMGDKVGEQRWFQNSMTGLQLTVPIFGSGQRYARIRKAQINLEKARTTKEMMTDRLLLQEKQLRYNLVNANLQYKSQKENVEVSKRVYRSTENKFEQGMASSLDVTQANGLYLQAENNYISALMNLLQTKLALDKLLNNL